MHGGPEPLGAPPSFTARRPNASNLPNFELPPPQLSNLNKINPYGNLNASAPQPLPHTVASVGNLLTPPSNVPGDGLSPVSTGVTSNSSTSAQGFTPNGYWGSPPTQGQASFSYPQSSAPSQYNQPSRGLYSQGPPQQRAMTYSQPSPKGLPPPPYDLNLPPFPSSGSMSAPAQMPAMSGPQHGMPHMMGSHTPVSTGAPQQSPVHAQEQFQPQQHRQPPTPTYYHQSAAQTPQASTFPYSTGPSPTQQSPLSAGGPMRMSPANTSGPIPSLHAPAHSPHPYPRPAYQPYALPGPVLSNVGNPQGGLALVGGMPPNFPGGFNSGHAATMGHMYGGHQAHQPPPTNERPFKCDQCPQSFNRNHDLKRHKRIHLAVKPFPCGHCDKSFSRKDALKRHILVKGCGKAQAAGDNKDDDDHSANDKSSSVGGETDHRGTMGNH